MKSLISLSALAALVLVPSVRLVFGQVDPGPSPTNSIGCAPHNDHWHCEGALVPTAAPVSTPLSGVSTTADVESVSAVTSASASTSSGVHDDHDDHEDHDHDEDDHDDHASGNGSLAPSPTASIGCQPHGDHWHCDGPRPAVTSVNPTRVISNTTVTSTSRATNSTSSAPTSSTSLVSTGGAGAMVVGSRALAGVLSLICAVAL